MHRALAILKYLPAVLCIFVLPLSICCDTEFSFHHWNSTFVTLSDGTLRIDIRWPARDFENVNDFR